MCRRRWRLLRELGRGWRGGGLSGEIALLEWPRLVLVYVPPKILLRGDSERKGVASSSILKNLSNYGRWPPFTLFLLMNSWSRVDTNLEMRFLLSRFRVVIDTAALLWVPPNIHEPRLGNDQVATRKSAQSEVPLRITPTQHKVENYEARNCPISIGG